MSSGSSLTSKLYDKIIKMLSKSHETIPLIFLCDTKDRAEKKKLPLTVRTNVEKI
jgi:hypothetical protein